MSWVKDFLVVLIQSLWMSYPWRRLYMLQDYIAPEYHLMIGSAHQECHHAPPPTDRPTMHAKRSLNMTKCQWLLQSKAISFTDGHWWWIWEPSCVDCLNGLAYRSLTDLMAIRCMATAVQSGCLWISTDIVVSFKIKLTNCQFRW